MLLCLSGIESLQHIYMNNTLQMEHIIVCVLKAKQSSLNTELFLCDSGMPVHVHVHVYLYSNTPQLTATVTKELIK